MVDTILAGLDQGQEPAAFHEAFKQMKANIDGLAARCSQRIDNLVEFRKMFNLDAQILIRDQADLSARRVPLESRHRALDKKLSKLRDELKAMNIVQWFPVIGLLVKLGSEVYHLIAEQKTAEQAFSETSRDLSRIDMELAQINMMIGQCNHIGPLIDQLTSGTQAANNVVQIAQGVLSDEQSFLLDANDAPRLMMVALKDSFRNLADVAD